MRHLGCLLLILSLSTASWGVTLRSLGPNNPTNLEVPSASITCSYATMLGLFASATPALQDGEVCRTSDTNGYYWYSKLNNQWFLISSVPQFTFTPTFTKTFTSTPTKTPTCASSWTPGCGNQFTPTFTPTPTFTGTPTCNPSWTPGCGNQFTFTSTLTPTNTPTYWITFTPTVTFTPTPGATQELPIYDSVNPLNLYDSGIGINTSNALGVTALSYHATSGDFGLTSANHGNGFFPLGDGTTRLESVGSSIVERSGSDHWIFLVPDSNPAVFVGASGTGFRVLDGNQGNGLYMASDGSNQIDAENGKGTTIIGPVWCCDASPTPTCFPVATPH